MTDITKMAIALAAEMHRQGIGGYKCGPTFVDHLIISIDVRDATPREVERHRCKKHHTRGGRRFRCELMGGHSARPCLIRTKKGGYQTVGGDR